MSVIRRVSRLRTKKLSAAQLRSKVPLEGWIFTWESAVEQHDASRSVLPQLANTDGDPLLLTKDRFQLEPRDRGKVESELGRLADAGEHDGDAGAERSYTFHRPGNAMNAGWDNTIVGRAVVRQKELLLETNSVRRADDLRARVEAALGPLVRYRIREHEDPQAMLRGQLESGETKPRRDEAQPPELLEALRSFKEQHLKGWLDSPIPALGGLTPRQAAMKPRKRQQVELLLKEIENQESRAPAAQRIDASVLWKELGLEGGRGG